MSNYETSQTSDLKELISKLRDTQTLSKNEWIRLIDGRTPELADYLFENAREVRITHYGHDVYVRGLIEFTNYCRNDCYYCGIRKSNLNAHRYRLTKEEILNCCKTGYELGFAPSFFKVVKMAGSRLRVWLILSLTSTKTGRTVQSHSLLEKWNMMHTRLYSMPALTAIYFAMKLIMMHITVSFILLP